MSWGGREGGRRRGRGCRGPARPVARWAPSRGQRRGGEPPERAAPSGGPGHRAEASTARFATGPKRVGAEALRDSYGFAALWAASLSVGSAPPLASAPQSARTATPRARRKRSRYRGRRRRSARGQRGGPGRSRGPRARAPRPRHGRSRLTLEFPFTRRPSNPEVSQSLLWAAGLASASRPLPTPGSGTRAPARSRPRARRAGRGAGGARGRAPHFPPAWAGRGQALGRRWCARGD